MRRKMMKKIGKRITAVALSLILTVGMFWGNCRLEASASGVTSPYTVKITAVLHIRGYEGEGTPEFGKVVLRLYMDRDNDDAYVDISESEMTKSGSGADLTYEYSFEGGKYYQAKLGIDAGEGFTSTGNVMVGTGFFGDDKDEVIGFNGIAYRHTFVDGNAVYREQYAGSFHDLYNFDDPEKSNHTFVGWEWGHKKRIDSLSYIRTRWIQEPFTFEAVWEHPAEDTWDWNNDSDSHWKECSCGELKTEAEAHTWDEGIITREPTETENGIKTYSCKDCGAVLGTEVLPATGTPSVSGNDTVSGNNPPQPDKPNVPGNNDTPANPDIPDNNDVPANPDITGNNQAPANNITNVNISQSNEGNSANTTTATGKNKEPKTGDIPYVEIYATVAMIAGMSYLLLYFCDDERGMSEEEKQELVSRLIVWAKKGGDFRRIVALTAIFFLLCYYHGIGKRVGAWGFEMH